MASGKSIEAKAADWIIALRPPLEREPVVRDRTLRGKDRTKARKQANKTK